MEQKEIQSLLDSMNSRDGVFETLRVRAEDPEYLGYHLERLKEGCEFISADFPDVDFIALVKKLSQENMLNGKTGRMKIIVYIDEDDKSHFCVTLAPYGPFPRAGYSSGVQLITAMHPCCESALARIKCTRRGGYANLRNMSADKGYFDCMLTDRRGVITETTFCSLFLVEDGSFFVPPCDCSRLLGVMERVVVEELAAIGIKVQEKEYRSKNITSETGMFITNSLLGVMPVKSVNRTVLKNVRENPGLDSIIGKLSPYPQ